MTTAVDNKIYFNPAYDEVKQLIVNGVREIVENYSIDAIHFDDYFYPTTSADFDKKEYKKYIKELVSEFVLSPNASYDLIIFVPMNTYSCIIQTNLKESNNEVYSDYHQL